MCLVRNPSGRRIDDASVADEDIPDRIPTVVRIDYASTGKTDQHGRAAGSAAVILPITLATDIAALGLVALAAASVAVAARCSTASWSMPGRPTAIATSALRASGWVLSAISGSLRFHVGDRAP